MKHPLVVLSQLLNGKFYNFLTTKVKAFKNV